MKAYEFPTKISSEGMLEIPAPFVEMLPRNEIVRVIVLVSEPTDVYEHKDWSDLTAKEFFAGYADSDSIYDENEQ
jgi:hypothetical protein